MALMNGDYFHHADIKKFLKNFLWNRKKKNGYGPLKHSGEQSRAILALLFL